MAHYNLTVTESHGQPGLEVTSRSGEAKKSRDLPGELSQRFQRVRQNARSGS